MVETLPLISVIVPVYNAEKYLNKCVDSIRNQTYYNLEIILVDDGSVDNSPTICDEYADLDKRIKVIHKINGGLSSARNAGLNIFKGEYVGFIDSDDYIEYDMYYELYLKIKKNNCCVACTKIQREYENGKIIPMIGTDEKTQSWKLYLRDLLLHKGDVSVCSKLFVKSVFDKCRFDETKLNEDLLFMFSIKELQSIVYTDKVGYHYVAHNSNSITSSFGKTTHDMVTNSMLVYDFVKHNIPEFNKEAERFAIYQNMAFLRSCPSDYDREKDTMCELTLSYLRKNFVKSWLNKYLSIKEKIVMTVIVVNPVFVSRILEKHRKSRIKKSGMI